MGYALCNGILSIQNGISKDAIESLSMLTDIDKFNVMPCYYLKGKQF